MVLTDEDRRNLRVIAMEISEVKKLIDELAESLVNMSDKVIF